MICERFEATDGAYWTYLVGDLLGGKAVLIDPGAEVQVYLDAARARGLDLEHVFVNDFGRRVPAGLLALRERGRLKLHVSARAWTPPDVSSLLPGCTVTVGALRIRLVEDEAGNEAIAVFRRNEGDPDALAEPLLVTAVRNAAA